jgi:hypothetical protein
MPARSMLMVPSGWPVAASARIIFALMLLLDAPGRLRTG